MKKLFLLALFFIVIVLGAYAYIFFHKMSQLSDAMGCENNIVLEVSSDNKEKFAALIARSCGATAPNTYQVYILGARTEHDYESYTPILVMENKNNPPSLVWLDNNRLTVHTVEDPKIYQQIEKFDGVQIIYE